MQVLLRIANGKSNVRKVRIQSDTVIGRSPECQLKVASNQISRRHCQIVIRDTVVAIKDLGSANGTFVNGRQVPPDIEVPLTPGTRVMLGPLQFTVEYELPGLISSSRTVSQQDEETTAEDEVDLFNSEPPEVVQPAAAVAKPAVTAPVPPVIAAASIPFAEPVAEEESGIPDGSWLTGPPPNEAAVLGQTAFMMNPLQGMPVEDLRPPAPVPAAVVQQPVAPMPVAAVVLPPQAIPTPPVAEFVPPQPAVEEPDANFNFGIFAASGSGVVVESAAEMPIFDPSLAPAEPTAPAPAKPAKKGFLQMLGWGKKKPAAAPAEPVAEAEAPAGEEIVEEVIADNSPFGAAAVETVADVDPSFELPLSADDEAASGDDDAPDESLQNFFNNFK